MADDQENMIELDRPTRGAKDGYLQLFFISRQQLGRIISDPDGAVTDQRIITYTKFLISSITDDDIRDQVKEMYAEKIQAIKAEKLDNETRHEKMVDATMDVLGDVTAFYDEFLGITHRLKVGIA